MSDCLHLYLAELPEPICKNCGKPLEVTDIDRMIIESLKFFGQPKKAGSAINEAWAGPKPKTKER